MQLDNARTASVGFDEKLFYFNHQCLLHPEEIRSVSKLLSKCGINCEMCPWGPYPRQDMTAEEYKEYKRMAKKILGHVPMKIPCLTCQTPDEEIPRGWRLPPRSCLVRQCVDTIGVENCAYCSKFPCETLEATAGVWNREAFEEKHGAPIPEEDYIAFIKPFEGLIRLQAFRDTIKPSEIVEAAKMPPLKTKIADFPENLPFPEEKVAAYRALHQTLANLKRSPLGLKDTDLLAQQQRLKKRTSYFMKFFWTLGSFGELRDKDGVHLFVNAKEYTDNQGSPTMFFVKNVVFKVLSEFGVNCKLVMLEGVEEKDLTTPTGYLRSKGWQMVMAFDEKAGGAAALEALQTFSGKLGEKYGKKAFRYFSNVDMQVLIKDL